MAMNGSDKRGWWLAILLGLGFASAPLGACRAGHVVTDSEASRLTFDSLIATPSHGFRSAMADPQTAIGHSPPRAVWRPVQSVLYRPAGRAALRPRPAHHVRTVSSHHVSHARVSHRPAQAAHRHRHGS